MRLPLLLLIAALTLTACTAGVKQTEGPLLLPPASLTILPPEELPQPETGGQDDLLDNHIKAAGMYHELRIQLKGLVDWLEKTNNELR